MRLLVTRPKEDADSLSQALLEKGHEAVRCPLLTIAPDPKAAQNWQTLAKETVQGLIMTSANGVRSFCALEKKRTWPVYAVGDATARAAMEAGFKTVHSAQGDVASLATLIVEKVDPTKGALVHSAGSDVAGDLKGALDSAKYRYERLVTYRADLVTALPPAIVADFKAGRYDGVILYSPRTADHFVSLVKKEKIAANLKSVTAYVLSQAVADGLKSLTFKAVQVAQAPEQAALLTLLPAADPVKQDAKASSQQKGAKPKEAKPQSPKKKMSWRLKLSLGVVGIALVGAGTAYGTQDLWLDGVKQRIGQVLSVPVAPDAVIVQLQDRITALENRPQAMPAVEDVRVPAVVNKLAALETAFAAQAGRLENLTQAASQAVGATETTQGAAALAVLQERLQGLEAVQAENARLAQLLAELNNRLADVESAQLLNRSASENAQALIAAFSLVRETARSSQSFAAGLESIARLGQGDEVVRAAVERLAPFAESGVASLATLRSDFERVSKDMVRAQAVPQEAGWLTQTVANITSLITVRPAADAVGGDGVLGAVAKALYGLKVGDLPMAIEAVRPLDGQVKVVVDPWLEAAEQRVVLDETLQALHGHILGLIGQGVAVTGGQG